MKIYSVIRTAIYWALTALVIVFTALSTLAEQIEVLRYFIGGLMIFYGVEEMILTAIKNKKHYDLHTLYWNLIEIVIGLALIVFVETGEVEEVTYAVVCVSWAIWSILREVRELVEATEELKERKSLACKIVPIVSILESLTVIVLSLTMIIEPGEHHAKIHLYLLSVELFTKALFPIVNATIERVVEKRGKTERIAAPEPQVSDEQQSESPELQPETEKGEVVVEEDKNPL